MIHQAKMHQSVWHTSGVSGVNTCRTLVVQCVAFSHLDSDYYS